MSKAFGHLDGAWSCLVFFLPIKQHLLTRQHLKCPEEGEWAANKQTGRNSATKVLLKHSPCAGQRVRALLIARAVIFNGLPAPNEKGGLAPGGVMCLAVNLSNHQGSSLLIQRSAVQQGWPGEERPAPRHSPGSAQGIGMAQQLHPPNPAGNPTPTGAGAAPHLPQTPHSPEPALCKSDRTQRLCCSQGTRTSSPLFDTGSSGHTCPHRQDSQDSFLSDTLVSCSPFRMSTKLLLFKTFNPRFVID